MAITPSWTDNVSVIASQSLALGASVSGTLDLTTKVAAYVFIRFGRTGTTALGSGVMSLIRRTLNANAIGHPGSVFAVRGATIAASSTTVGTDSAAGQKTLLLTSGTGFAADDYILIGAGTAREEWARVSSVATNTLTLDRNLTYTHTAAQADIVTNKAECYDPAWVVGGGIIEVVVDHLAATGEAIQVEVLAQTYNSDVT